MRLIQVKGPAGRRVGIVDGDIIHLMEGVESIHGLAQAALTDRMPLAERATSLMRPAILEYPAIWRGESEWRVLPAIDHPVDAARCLVSGTGLSHIRSAANRQAMHAADEHPTDSMRMYQWGVDGGRPAAGEIGTSPEWFFKGTGTSVRAHNEPLDVPPYAEDGGEEPEIAGVYMVDDAGSPRRIGMVAGNEFSDHEFEKKNYLYLASSKMRTCAIGPELVVDPDFGLVNGEVAIERDGQVIWQKAIHTGESVMCHNLANMEHHHFKFEAHRRPGDIHVHFFGADAFSFGEGVRLQDGDVMQVQFKSFGRPLRNPVRVSKEADALVTVRPV